MIHIFIVNSFVTKRNFREKLKNHLKNRNDIRWFVFSTSHAGMEAEIALKMTRFFEGEKLRFYCCGGSGTFRNVINAVKEYPDYEAAFYPCGVTNDFLKVFGEDEIHFRDIDKLIDGRVEYLDYIKTNNGIAINTVSFGIDTSICLTLERVKSYDVFGSFFPFFLAYFKALLIDFRYKRYEFRIDNNATASEMGEMIIGNGCTLGGDLCFTDDPNVTDGQLDYFIASSSYGSSLMRIMNMMRKKDIQNVRKNSDNGRAAHFEIVSADGKDIEMNLDGELVRGGAEWTVEVVSRGIKFVVPYELVGFIS